MRGRAAALIAVAVLAFSVLITGIASAATMGPARTARPPAATASAVSSIRAAVAEQARFYTVRRGDTLSVIAARLGIPDWQDLWWWNRGQVRDPDVITAGQVLTVYRWVVPYASWEPYVRAQADAALPKPPPPPKAVTVSVAQPKSSAPVQTGTVAPFGSSFQQCVIERESGGNPAAQNPSSTASGLYQFLDSTWNDFDGYPRAMDAPVAVQNEYFAIIYARDGTSPWAPYDGC